jgi:predicted acetyltransferase
MGIDVRIVPEEDRERWFQVCSAAFSDEVRAEDKEADAKLLPVERRYGAYADGSLVGTAADFALTLSVPGGEVSAAGVTMVGVAPSHRRQGALNLLMQRQLADARDRGDPVAILWASEGPIYGRYGFGMATRVAGIDADRASMAFGAPDPGARVRLVDADEAAQAFPPIYEHVRRETPGAIVRSDDWWKLYRLRDPEWRRHGAGPWFHALLELEGEPAGYASYRVKGDWDEGFAQSQLRVIDPVATSPRAVHELWRFLFGVDLVQRVRSWPLPPDHPLFLFAREPRKLRLKIGDGLWLRILDVESALAARSYAEGGELVLELADSAFPENAGLWRLEVRDGGAAVERGTGEPTLRLDVQALASTFLGGFSFAELQAARLVEELAGGGVAMADALFRTPREPWCLEVF